MYNNVCSLVYIVIYIHFLLIFLINLPEIQHVEFEREDTVDLRSVGQCLLTTYNVSSQYYYLRRQIDEPCTVEHKEMVDAVDYGTM